MTPGRPRPPARLGRRRARALREGRGTSGQSSIELVASLPVLVAVALAIGHVLAAGHAREQAGHAAEAGAIALLGGGDPARAATTALPGWSRRRVEVEHDGGVVRVRLEPPALVPGVADRLAATAIADAGPSAGRPSTARARPAAGRPATPRAHAPRLGEPDVAEADTGRPVP